MKQKYTYIYLAVIVFVIILQWMAPEGQEADLKEMVISTVAIGSLISYYVAQNDIEALKKEKTELKNQVDTLAKKLSEKG